MISQKKIKRDLLEEENQGDLLEEEDKFIFKEYFHTISKL